MNDLHFYVFSYNRGEFLANCVRSIEDCAPEAPITIVDDDSDDPATRETLTAIAERHEVMGPGTRAEHKHGGLYGNMQAALDSAAPEELVCFLQDDTQLVRRLDPSEPGAIARRFEQKPELGFLSPCFLRGRSWRRKGGMQFTRDASIDLFFPCHSGHSAGIHYSDIAITQVGRLRSHGWRFEVGEGANDRAAARRFGPMGYLPEPFAMWLPSVPAYRGRTKSLTLRLAERHRGCGLYPLSYLDAKANARLRRERGEHPPVAEHWLPPTSRPLGFPWFYDPLNGSRWLKQLNRIELLVRAGAGALRSRLSRRHTPSS